MKTYTLLLALLIFFSAQVYAQLQYEGSIDSKNITTQLENGAIKYIKYDKKLEKVLIYNLDNSLWRSIKLQLPKYHRLHEIKSISQFTFNNDEQLELVYSSVVYKTSNNLEDPNEDYFQTLFTLNIVNEDGESLLKVGNCNDMKIVDSNGEKKLLVFKNSGTQNDKDGETLIYSLNRAEDLTKKL